MPFRDYFCFIRIENEGNVQRSLAVSVSIASIVDRTRRATRENQSKHRETSAKAVENLRNLSNKVFVFCSAVLLPSRPSEFGDTISVEMFQLRRGVTTTDESTTVWQRSIVHRAWYLLPAKFNVNKFSRLPRCIFELLYVVCTYPLVDVSFPRFSLVVVTNRQRILGKKPRYESKA